MNFGKSASTSKSTEEKYIIGLLKDKLPQSTAKAELDKGLDWNFMLNIKTRKKAKGNVKKKKIFLTCNERRKLDILKVPKQGWNYKELEIMRELWKGYMRKNLSLYKKVPNVTHSNWNNFNITLGKSEFIGADLTVIRSKVVNQVGMTGTVVFETKATFQIVNVQNELKTLIKEPSVFSFKLDDIIFTIFGKHMLTRPSERSVKKLKQNILPDL
ncbi:hypothetical protein FQA39_LY12537 [Lamprigera yunnana]|nr:hypothetical protein FQA39_LY12537 [Lamprigera yunnana]